MVCNAIQVINGSVLTFESLVKICDVSVITNNKELTHFHFSDKLQEGLSIANKDKDIMAQYSLDSVTYKKFDSIETAFNPDTQLLDVQIEKSKFNFLSSPLYVKVIFKARVDNVDTLLLTKNNNNSILINQGVFNTIKKENGNIVQYFSKDARTDYSAPIEKYYPKISAYSITVCPNDKKNFNANLCFNAITGAYSDKNGNLKPTKYILTIKPTTGIYIDQNIKKEDIKITTNCFCKDDSENITNFSINLSNEFNTKGLIITIPYTTKYFFSEEPFQGVDMCGKCISLSIPYNISVSSYCDIEPTSIEGSIEFVDDNNTSLTKLNNFISYINFDCRSDLKSICKVLIC